MSTNTVLSEAARILEEATNTATDGICPAWTKEAVRHIAANCNIKCKHTSHQEWFQAEWDHIDDVEFIMLWHPAMARVLIEWLRGAEQLPENSASRTLPTLLAMNIKKRRRAADR